VYLLASLYTDGRTRASIKQTTGIQNLDLDSLLSNRVRLPSVVAQTKIADYLDAETTRIDALIAKRRRMIELLELRQDIAIREAVALAHATSQPLRQPLKRRWRVIDCKHRTPAYAETGYPVVSPGDVTPGNLDLSRCHRFVGEADFRDLTEGRGARRGDIIYSRNASIGIASYVATDEPFTMGQDVCLITSDDADQRYLTYYLNTFGLDQLDEAKIGSTFSRVNISQIKELLVPVLSRLEQSRIADQLDATSARYRRSTASLTRQIELLVERRQALITAAVTGELDIAGVAA
jgi:type I restriction enzyme S subunit